MMAVTVSWIGLRVGYYCVTLPWFLFDKEKLSKHVLKCCIMYISASLVYYLHIHTQYKFTIDFVVWHFYTGT